MIRLRLIPPFSIPSQSPNVHQPPFTLRTFFSIKAIVPIPDFNPFQELQFTNPQVYGEKLGGSNQCDSLADTEPDAPIENDGCFYDR